MAKPVYDAKVKRWRDPITGGFMPNPNGTSKPKKKSTPSKPKAIKSAKPAPQIKQYIAFVRDHSGSMGGLATTACKDFNENLKELQAASLAYGVDTRAMVISFGVNTYGARYHGVEVSEQVCPIAQTGQVQSYMVYGQTPMYDAIGLAIEQFEALPDANDPNVSFLICTTTDGAENASRYWSQSRLRDKIQQLTATDRWTFAFRAPLGNRISNDLGVPRGNVLVWETTNRGLQEATGATIRASASFMDARSKGLRSTQSYYQTDLSNVTATDLKTRARDITAKVTVIPTGNMVHQIRDLVKQRTGNWFAGTAFYLLNKTEKEVQEYKRILVRDRATGKIYGGDGVREMLGLDVKGTVKIVPGNHANFDVFIQSNSVNRRLIPNTDLLVWLGN